MLARLFRGNNPRADLARPIGQDTGRQPRMSLADQTQDAVYFADLKITA